jgi:general secretion pathway protein G
MMFRFKEDTMQMKNERKVLGQQGFTLVEIMIVVVILGLLVGLVGPKIFKQFEKAERGTAKAQIEMLGTSVDTFRLDMRRYPKELDELLRKPSDDKNWDGPYVKKDLPTDPWERPYVYKCPGDDGRDYDIISYGADGQPGGDGENADINNWESLKKSKE